MITEAVAAEVLKLVVVSIVQELRRRGLTNVEIMKALKAAYDTVVNLDPSELADV